MLIVESTAPDEIYDSKREGLLLADLLKLLDIETQYRLCVDRPRLRRAFEEARRATFDAVHFACHGDGDGVRLTSKEDVSWTDLAELIGDSLHRKLLVLSACLSGGPALPNQFRVSGKGPGIIVGTNEKIHWDDAAIGWQLLYKWLSERKPISEALRKVSEVLDIQIVYRRWAESEYKRLTAPVTKQ